MKQFCKNLAQFCHVVILGALIGFLAGFAEYFLLYLRQAFSGDLTRVYWEIVLPHAIAGAAGGLLVAGALRVALGRASSFSHHFARLLASVIGAVLFAYLVVWATYQLDRPLLKLSNLIAYLASAAVAVLFGLLLFRIVRALLLRLESKGARSLLVMKRGLLAAQSGLLAVVLLFPTVYLERVRSVQLPGVGPSNAEVGAKQPNIVFILIDALRADHLPIYGYSRQTAPNITAMAKQGMIFTGYHSQASSTRPSVATLFTSMFPSVHKANDDLDFLSDSVTTLAEVLRAAGYKTFGVSANANVSPTFGYAQGFDEFRAWKTESAFRLTLMGRFAEDALGPKRLGQLLRETGEIVPRADALTDVTLQWVQKNEKGPHFLYIHYIDPHDPYTPPSPYDRAFDYRKDPPARLGGADPLALIKDVDPGEIAHDLARTLAPAVASVPNDTDRDRVGRTLDQYDGEILYADSHFGRLLKGLKELGVLDNAIVIVTADHGEEFYEHGNGTHGKSLYEEVLRVPFIISWPGRIPAGVTYSGQVGHIDFMPTILSLLNIKAPPTVEGISYAAQLSNPSAPLPKRRHFAQQINRGFSLEMVRDDNYKMVRNVRGQKQGSNELFDLERDPLERQNIALRSAPQVAVLKEELDSFNKFLSQATTLVRAERLEKLDRDTERALRSLGYIK